MFDITRRRADCFPSNIRRVPDLIADERPASAPARWVEQVHEPGAYAQTRQQHSAIPHHGIPP
jgi:hypothetical protein